MNVDRPSTAKSRVIRALAIFFLTPVALFFLLDLIFPFPVAKLVRPPAVAIYDRNGDALRVILPADQKLRIPIALDEVPPEVIKAILTSEDRWFWRHPGVNPVAVLPYASHLPMKSAGKTPIWSPKRSLISPEKMMTAIPVVKPVTTG